MTVYKSITLVGTSGTSVSDAIRAAVERAGETLEDLRWFEVREIRGRLEEGEIVEFQVAMDVGFRLHAAARGNGEGAKQRAGSRATRSLEAQEASRRGQRRRSDLAEGFAKKGARKAGARGA